MHSNAELAIIGSSINVPIEFNTAVERVKMFMCRSIWFLYFNVIIINILFVAIETKNKPTQYKPINFKVEHSTRGSGIARFSVRLNFFK